MDKCLHVESVFQMMIRLFFKLKYVDGQTSDTLKHQWKWKSFKWWIYLWENSKNTRLFCLILPWIRLLEEDFFACLKQVQHSCYHLNSSLFPHSGVSSNVGFMWLCKNTSFCFLSAFNSSIKMDIECWEKACHILGRGGLISLHYITVTTLAYISSSLHTWQAPAGHQHFFLLQFRRLISAYVLTKKGNLILEQSRPTGRASLSSTCTIMTWYLTHTTFPANREHPVAHRLEHSKSIL